MEEIAKLNRASLS